MTRTTADVAVIGSGTVGLCAALALADAQLDVVLYASVQTGEASAAAGGILDASHGFSDPAICGMMAAARDGWPTFLSALEARTGVTVPSNRSGVLDLAGTLHEAEKLAGQTTPTSQWLSATELTALEPALAHMQGALHHVLDATVNPLLLLKALRHAVGRHRHIRVLSTSVSALDTPEGAGSATILSADGQSMQTRRAIVAAGAWSGTLPGLTRALPLHPLRGQLMSVASKALRHTVFRGHAYAIPRGDGRTILGVDDVDAGFDAQHTAEGAARVREMATGILPAFGSASMLSTWAGLRPMTPDGLPIVGADPAQPAIVYATGHGRNGLLLAPLTAEMVVATVCGHSELTAAHLLRPTRFADTHAPNAKS